MNNFDIDIQLEPDGFIDIPQQGSPLDDFVVLLSQNVIQQVRNHTELHLRQEVGGMLIGEIWEQYGTTYVYLKECIASSVEGTLNKLSFTPENWLALEQEREEKFPFYKKVGWYHSHLGYGVFLSMQDKFLHECAFSLPWHIAFVHDPVLSEYGIFHWYNGELVPARFYITPESHTFRENLFSTTISHQLSVLSSYLDDTSGKDALTMASRQMQTRLQHRSAEPYSTVSPVNDIINTLLDLATLDIRALQQARSLLEEQLGHPLLPGRNAELVSPLLFRNTNMAIVGQYIYFLQDSSLLWAPLDTSQPPSLINTPTSLSAIAADQYKAFALDTHGTVYIVPLDTAQQAGVSLHTLETYDGRSQMTLKRIIFSSPPSATPQRLVVRNDTLYLASKSQVWMLSLNENIDRPGNLQPRVFNLEGVDSDTTIEIEDLVVDDQGNMYLADMANGRVVKMQPDGHIPFMFVGSGQHPLMSPMSMCICKNELFILDISIRHIIVYNLENNTYSRHYTWGHFEPNTVQQLYVDDAAHVYFSLGHTAHQLYLMKNEVSS